MDLSFLTPVFLAEAIGGIAIIILLCKATGLNFSKGEKGLRIGFFTENNKSLGRIEEGLKLVKEDIALIVAANEKQEICINNISKDQLRITLYAQNLPLLERCVAAKCYLAIGGNGETQKYIERHFLDTDEWKMLENLSSSGYSLDKLGLNKK
jgi:hypothetical protein